MTETMKNTDRFAIDPVAFFVALVGAPVVVAVLGFWVLMPLFALVIGWPYYLVLGLPSLLIYLYYNEGTASGAALLAASVCAAGILIWIAFVELTGVREVFDDMEPNFFPALFFAPIWGGMFGVIYNRFRKPGSRNPIPAIV